MKLYHHNSQPSGLRTFPKKTAFLPAIESESLQFADGNYVIM